MNMKWQYYFLKMNLLLFLLYEALGKKDNVNRIDN